jgi:hypothetical protein
MPNAMERPETGEWVVLPESERRTGKSTDVSKIHAANSAGNEFWTETEAPKMFAPKRRTNDALEVKLLQGGDLGHVAEDLGDGHRVRGGRSGGGSGERRRRRGR